MRNFKKILPVLLLTICFGTSAYADEPKQQVGIDEQLGTEIPLDLTFINEYGKPVTLISLFTKPTILTLVYYRCPGICSPLLTGVADVVDRMDLEPGRDFNIVTISFNPREDYIMASEKKKNYTDNMKKKVPSDSWQFLTGDSLNIAKITDAVGFRYQPQGQDYMHGAAITVISPKGKIARYLYGVDFLPLDVKLALTEASEGKSTPAINKLLKLCYSYDPSGRKYVLNITRIIGGGMILIIACFVLILTLRKQKSNHNNLPAQNGEGSISHG